MIGMHHLPHGLHMWEWGGGRSGVCVGGGGEEKKVGWVWERH